MVLPIVDSVKHTRRDTAVAWLFVAIQFALLAVMVFYPRDAGWIPTDLMRTVGFVFMAAGVGVGLWAAVYLGRGLTPSPLPNGSVGLVMRGPYRFVRHPMYTSVILLGIGMTIRSGSWVVLFAFVVLVLLFAVKSRWEEAHLADAFPGYERYMTSTGRFVPRIAS
jgi:protein-S-isoprenylcysteine O-methyltransferase Ste14